MVAAFCHRVWIFRLELLSLLVGAGAETCASFVLPLAWRTFAMGISLVLYGKFGANLMALRIFAMYFVYDCLLDNWMAVLPHMSWLPWGNSHQRLAWHLFWACCVFLWIMKASPARALGARPADGDA